MRRNLQFKQAVISGDVVREIINIFPITENSFSQRKNYDEYYYNLTEVELSINDIEDLTKLGFILTINWESIIIE